MHGATVKIAHSHCSCPLVYSVDCSPIWS